MSAIPHAFRGPGLQAALAQAHLPALMPALACLTGDLAALDAAWQPDLSDQAQRPQPQAGLSAQAQQAARERAQALIERWDADGRPAPSALDAALLQRVIRFVTGDVDPAVADLLLHELGLTDVATTPGDLAGLRPDFHVAVIGAGMSGLLASWHLARAGVSHTVYERQSSLGGVWAENHYPGCRLDTSNFCYSYSFHQQAGWRHHFSPREEVLRYFEDVARAHGIDGRIRLRTRVVALAYDDVDQRWQLELERDGRRERVQADAVISAVGQLNEPRLPQIPGVERYTGQAWHTARWNHAVALDGLRVGVIGTGASAFQVVPQIAPRVQSLRVFQRTPPWVVPTPSYTRELPAGLHWLLEHLPGYNAWYRFEQFWVAVEGRRRYSIVDPTWTRPGSVSALNQQLREMLEQDIRASYPGRPDLQRLMTPGYPPYAKRMLRDDGAWPAALMRDNVRVESSPIREFTPTGVQCADGSEHELDVVIFGTGFRASEFLSSMEVRGRAGADLHAQWGDEPQAYRGICVPGFPNLFLLYGPNTNLITNGSLVLFGEFEIEFVMRCLRALAARGARAMEPTVEAAGDDAQRVAAATRGMAYGIDGVRNWYKSASGRVTQNWPFSTLDFWRQTREVRVQDFTFHG
ncbi:MAG: NAD(P)-binding protein [Rubrivivax sp.]